MPRELLFSITKKDFDIEWFSGSGAGGQHRNKHQNCCRLRHPASGVVKTGTRSRSREQNLNEAFKKLREDASFKLYLHGRIMEALMEETLEQRINKAMLPANLKIECLVEGQWEVVDEI